MRPTRWFGAKLPPINPFVPRPDDERVRLFRSLLRNAGKPHAVDPWRQTRAGLLMRSAEGCWGQIVFYRPRLDGGLVTWELYAGALSPYLMRHVNRADPDRPPPEGLVAAHSWLVWNEHVRFSMHPTDSRGILSPETAGAWFEETFARLVPGVEELASEESIRQWLIARPGAWSKRMAALLTRHLGKDDELDEILRSAERATDEERELLRSKGLDPQYRDRQTTYPQDWSHARFVRFLEEAPR